MTDRERWIVYPLLFMALLYGFINAIERQAERKGLTSLTSLEIDTIHCRELRVVNDAGKTVAQLKVNNSNGAGVIEAANSNGVWQAMLTANSTSGVLGLMDSTGQSRLQITPPDRQVAPTEPATDESVDSKKRSGGDAKATELQPSSEREPKK